MLNSTALVRQQYIMVDVEYVFPNPAKTPAIDLKAFTEYDCIKLPRHIALVAGLEIEYADRLWVVTRVRLTARDLKSRKKGVIPLLTLSYQGQIN
jgi:hypothetical protein